ncbi:hypothetical protein D3C72_2498380 [compost metagenome]
MSARATELLERAPAVLKEWGFDSTALEVFKTRVLTGKTPADDMLDLYHKTNSLTEVLKSRSQFRV